MKIEVDRLLFENSNVNVLGANGHGPFIPLQKIEDVEHGWILEKYECDHCTFGFWTVRAGKYSDPNKQVYLLEEFELKIK